LTQSSNRAEKEKNVREQEEENGIEGIEEGGSSFSPVIFSVLLAPEFCNFLFDKYYCFFCGRK